VRARVITSALFADCRSDISSQLRRVFHHCKGGTISYEHICIFPVVCMTSGGGTRILEARNVCGPHSFLVTIYRGFSSEVGRVTKVGLFIAQRCLISHHLVISVVCNMLTSTRNFEWEIGGTLCSVDNFLSVQPAHWHSELVRNQS
jgi:hypothetical protein